jgi:hypothetical protein
MYHGLCSPYPDLHFADDEEAPDAAGVEQAKEICASCPVGERCLEWALSRRIDHGVWGGLTGQERRVLRSGGEKTCPRCMETKALDLFARQANRSDGRHTYCLACSRDRDAERREQRMAAQRKRRQRERALREAAAA